MPLLLCLSVLILFASYVTYNWPEAWSGGAAPLNWPGSTLSLTHGQGDKDSSGLNIEGLDDKGIAIAAVVTKSFPARDYATVKWNISGTQPDVEFAFLWRTAENPARLFSHALVPDKQGLASLDMLSDENWHGQIVGLALAAKGQLSMPVLVRGVSVKPVTLSQTLNRVLGQWLSVGGWDARSINFADANALNQDIPLLPAVFAAVLVGLALYSILTISHLLRVYFAVAGIIVLAGWLTLDMRWQWTLFKRVQLATQQYGGKSWEEKHLAAEDAPLFRFMQKAASIVPAGSRLMYFSDDAFSRGKGAYYLYPRNVLPASDFALAAKVKPGEYILTFAKQGVRYDAASRTLTADGSIRIPAELLYAADGNILVRVR